MATRGLGDFAQLRMRDRKPGPASYGAPLPLHSDAAEKSILNRTNLPVGWVNPVGPGSYEIPSTVGSGRAARLPPHADDVEVHLAERGLATSTKAAATTLPHRTPSPAGTDPKQHHMALSPDTPAFSMYGRLSHPDPWVQSPFPNVGPGSYTVPTEFPQADAPYNVPGSTRATDDETRPTGARAVKGKSFGIRTEAGGMWTASCSPGPGTYKVPRFADDEATREDAPRHSGRWAERATAPLGGSSPRWTRETTSLTHAQPTPGPCDYDDGTSLAARHGVVSGSPTPASARHPNGTFGARHYSALGEDPLPVHTVSPGPAAHDTSKETAVLATYASRPAPRFVPARFPPVDELPPQSSRSKRKAAGRSPQRSVATVASTRSLPSMLTQRSGAASSSRWPPHPLSSSSPSQPRRRETHLPSDFDYDFRKGFTLLGRWHERPPVKQPKHRYDVEEEERFARGAAHGRQASFARRPYDALSIAAQKEQAKERAQGRLLVESGRCGVALFDDVIPGPGAYQVQDEAVAPRSKGVLVATAEPPEREAGVPGPGHYAPRYDAVTPSPGGHGTTFHKGDFHRCESVHASACDDPGTASAEPRSLSTPPPPRHGTGSARANAGTPGNRGGFSFGVRYPARATHQVALPKDELTNVNCTYPEETRYESAPIIAQASLAPSAARTTAPVALGDVRV